MGEHSDYLIGRMIDGWSRVARPGARRYRLKTCKHCGKPGLSWAKIDRRWMLCERGKPHSCRRDVVLDEFEKLPSEGA